MIAWIDGIMAQGSPEEIEQYRMLNVKTTTTTDFFKTPIDYVPEHVKKYGEGRTVYIAKGQTHRVWY